MTMRKQLTAFLTALFLLLSGAAAWADYTEWKDSSYPFSAAKTIYLDQMDTTGVENLSTAEEWKLKDTFYRKISKIKVLNDLIAYMGKYGNRIIERQDKRVVITQKPKASAYQSQEKLLSGDGPIIQYRKIREELQNK